MTNQQKVFLENLKQDFQNQSEVVSELEQKVQEQQDEIAELIEYDSIIEAGIGQISYEKPTSIQLQSLMESLAEAIKNNGSLFVWSVLQTIEKGI